MSQPQQIRKKSRADITNPLAERGILQHVLGYVGPGHWLFAALVSKAWHQNYLQVPEGHLIGISIHCSRIPVVCVPRMTLYSAAVASVARLALALELGLDCTSNALQFAAGKWGTEAIIMKAMEAGMPIFYVSIGAVQNRYLATLQGSSRWSAFDCLTRQSRLQLLAAAPTSLLT
jgi:hypothetical protein